MNKKRFGYITKVKGDKINDLERLNKLLSRWVTITSLRLSRKGCNVVNPSVDYCMNADDFMKNKITIRISW